MNFQVFYIKNANAVFRPRPQAKGKRKAHNCTSASYIVIYLQKKIKHKIKKPHKNVRLFIIAVKP